jgi:hypothetical protein
MIDDTVILFTTIMCLIVVFRAIRLDNQLPWFGDGGRRRAKSKPVETILDPWEDPDRAP